MLIHVLPSTRLLVKRVTLRNPYPLSSKTIVQKRKVSNTDKSRKSDGNADANENANASAKANPNDLTKVDKRESSTLSESQPRTSQHASATLSPIARRLAYLRSAFDAYERVQRRRPWATQVGASLTVYLCGDMVAQYIDGEGYNPYRTLRHLTVGAGAAIPGYTWFMWLGRNFNYSSAILSLATKVVVNQLVFTPIFNSYFFSMQSLLAGSTVKEAYERVRNTLPTSFVNSCKLWPAVTAFSFWYIQPQFRFLFAGGVAVLWQSYLSWLNQRAAEEERLQLSTRNALT